MLILPRALDAEIAHFNSWAETSYGKNWTHHHPLAMAIELGLDEQWQDVVFQASDSAHWMNGVSHSNRVRKLAALAAHLERLSKSRTNLHMLRAPYPHVVPVYLEGKIRKLAHDIGHTPELALCAVLAISIGRIRALFPDTGEFEKRLPEALARFAA